MKYRVMVDGATFEVEVGDLDSRPVIAVVDGQRFEVWPEAAGPVGVAALASAAAPASAARTGAPAESQVPRPSRRTSGAQAAPPGMAGKVVYAPLPGLIHAVEVQPGDTVAEGQVLCVIEAMKMNNLIRASREGEIGRVLVQVGQHVRHNDPLIEYAG